MLRRMEASLLHGGHKGAESEFGRVAAEWGIRETTLSFEGHKMDRRHNVEVLSDAQLAEGRVSLEFVFQRMGRRFVSGTGVRRVIKMMFQLVVRSTEVFAIGWIQADGVVKGGTGWGVELAKVFNRKVHVFDQEKNAWFTWQGVAWEPSDPCLHEGVFAATGTRHLSDAGKQAIRTLFERSFGPANAESSELQETH